jgi:hypothetical protein
MPTIDDVKNILTDNKDRWLLGSRQGNDGNQGNTIEELLGVAENNLRIPDLGGIELKSQKAETGSLVTLFHKEPNPRGSVPNLLKTLGWKHQKAGGDYKHDEMSFRSTTYANRFTDRGFSIALTKSRIEFIFDRTKVNRAAKDVTGIYSTYGDWLTDVDSRHPHYSTVLPVFWDRKDFEDNCYLKLDSTLMVYLETKRINKAEYFRIVEAYIYKGFCANALTRLFSEGGVVIDFDARTRHNHGTKLRVAKDKIGQLFDFNLRIL